jgi:hypothetical protein
VNTWTRTCEPRSGPANGEDLREPDLILETKVLQSYVQMAKALYEISQDSPCGIAR